MTDLRQAANFCYQNLAKLLGTSTLDKLQKKIVECQKKIGVASEASDLLGVSGTHGVGPDPLAGDGRSIPPCNKRGGHST